jgi:hypothetical protein
VLDERWQVRGSKSIVWLKGLRDLGQAHLGRGPDGRHEPSPW